MRVTYLSPALRPTARRLVQSASLFALLLLALLLLLISASRIGTCHAEWNLSLRQERLRFAFQQAKVLIARGEPVYEGPARQLALPQRRTAELDLNSRTYVQVPVGTNGSLKWYPGAYWEANLPLAWPVAVLAPLAAMPFIMRLARRRVLQPPHSPSVHSTRTAGALRPAVGAMASVARRWLAAASILASMGVVCCLLRLAHGSATFRANTGWRFVAKLEYNSVTLEGPGPFRKGRAGNPVEFQVPGVRHVNYGQHQFLRVHHAVVLPVAALGVVPMVLHELRRRRAERRRNTGRCMACGYDLTGNVTGACPKCGRPSASGGFGNPPP